MKPNSLRIGNYVYDRGGKILKIDYWERPGMVAQNMVIEGITVHPMTEEVKYLKPIPLTEDWLIKFNIKKMPESEYTINTYNLAGFKLWMKDGKFLFNDQISIEYVHQIQNLYFALTSEEFNETIKA